jgi:hypothetical protein
MAGVDDRRKGTALGVGLAHPVLPLRDPDDSLRPSPVRRRSLSTPRARCSTASSTCNPATNITFDIERGGQRFLMVRPADEQKRNPLTTVRLVLNALGGPQYAAVYNSPPSYDTDEGNACGLIALLVASLGAQTPNDTSGEWRTYGGDLASTRYRPFDQIKKDNFNNLEVAWRLKTDNLGPRPEFNFQSTPLMVGGWLYTTAGTRRAVVALDAATGEMKWIHSEEEGKRGEEAPRQLSGRGLAYWSDGRSARIIYVTPAIACSRSTRRPARRSRRSARTASSI